MWLIAHVNRTPRKVPQITEQFEYQRAEFSDRYGLSLLVRSQNRGVIRRKKGRVISQNNQDNGIRKKRHYKKQKKQQRLSRLTINPEEYHQ